MIVSVTDYTVKQIILSRWVHNVSAKANSTTEKLRNRPRSRFTWAPLRPLRRWLQGLEIRTPQTARRLCRLIPAQCPFARELTLFGRTLLRIPPLCKLNPLYDELMLLRFRALSYLADECGEDISPYC